jgi:teichuronic acid biosynthesis glycosyltransferase TuaG
MQQPLISIITPNYNSEKFITDTIESVINQTYENWELIIVDDYSTDNSLHIIKQFVEKDARITLIKLSKNSGPAIARNMGIKTSKGNYIAFLDSDDSWFVNKLEKHLNFMEQKDIALSFTSYYSFDENKKDRKLINAKEFISYNNLLTNNYIGCLTVMYSVKHLGKVYFPDVLKRQDWALWLQITKNNVLAHGIKEPLANYTRRKSSVSSNKLNLLKYNWVVYRKFEKLNLVRSVFLMIILLSKKILK